MSNANKHPEIMPYAFVNGVRWGVSAEQLEKLSAKSGDSVTAHAFVSVKWVAI